MLYRHVGGVPPAVRFMLFSALCFALMSACVKLVSQHGIPILEIVAARAFISLVISYVDIRRKGLSVWGHDKPLLIARGVVGSLALMCVYYSVATIPLAEATLLQYMHPVFTAGLALVFLRERIQRATALCVLLSLLGLMLIVLPNRELDQRLALPGLSLVAALLGAFGSAVAYVIVRKLSRTDDSSVIIFYFPLIALPISLLLLGENYVVPTPEACLLLLLVGVFTQGGQVGLTKAMKAEAAGKAAAYSYVQVVFSVILGWSIFGDVPAAWTWVGGGLIILGALVNAWGSAQSTESQAPK